MNISLIGAGNVAWHLAQAIAASPKHKVCEIYARKINEAQDLAQKIGVNSTQSLDFSQSEAELFILAVRDDSIEEVASKLLLPSNALLVHTSGSVSLEALKNNPKNTSYGVFYPLMTFSKDKALDFSKVPLCIEAENTEDEQKLLNLAYDVSQEVALVDSKKRKTLHLAAVFACNFSNHLWAISQSILEEKNVSFNLLKPLIEETLQKGLKAANPADVQTGPARRGDLKIIENHKKALRTRPIWQKIYLVMTESILKWYGKI